MILEKESEIKVLRNFCNFPFEYFSVAQISKKTKISRNWVYKIINKFERFGFLEKSQKNYKLNFAVLFCKNLKLLLDSEYLCSLKRELNERIFAISNKITFEMAPESIILVGSAALNRQKEESDLDFLVIGKKKSAPFFENCNIIALNEEELKEKYLKGDDFVISALLFGRLIREQGVFIKLFESPLPIFSQEVIQEKIKYCEKLEERVYALLKTDESKAREELLYLALQTARIILLKKRIAPRTKHDIARQAKQFNPKIAALIKELLEKNTLKKEEMLSAVALCRQALQE